MPDKKDTGLEQHQAHSQSNTKHLKTSDNAIPINAIPDIYKLIDSLLMTSLQNQAPPLTKEAITDKISTLLYGAEKAIASEPNCGITSRLWDDNFIKKVVLYTLHTGSLELYYHIGMLSIRLRKNAHNSAF